MHNSDEEHIPGLKSWHSETPLEGWLRSWHTQMKSAQNEREEADQVFFSSSERN